jgi:GDP-L-fucose synthase
MNKKDKIYIAGHKGMVGSSIIRLLESKGYKNLLTSSHNELDLTNQIQVQDFFEKERPDYVILSAAKVGGIYANNSYPADFIYQNIMIEANVINSAFINKVKRLLFLGSSCIYPKSFYEPIKENDLLSNVLEKTNESYAIAKIAGIKLCEAYNRQHGTDFRSIMPTNLYGINDNFHPENSHVIPGLMKRFHEAKINNFKEVTVWGSGNAMREFLNVDDLAMAALFVLGIDKKIYDENTSPTISHINVGTGKDVTIKKTAEIMKEIVGFKGRLIFDTSKPDGTNRKLLDVSRLSGMGWNYSIGLKEGLKQTYSWYISEATKESEIVT